MFKNIKGGNICVETAIILPIVILGILTVAYLIKIDCITENVMSIAVDEAKQLNIESYTDLGKLKAIQFTDRLEKRLAEENKNCKEMRVHKFKYLYNHKNMDNLVSFQMDYRLDCNLTSIFYGSIYGREKVVTRAFVGSDSYNQIKGFSVMEEQEESEPVWIFPVSGKRYHKENCSYIKVAATKIRLTSDIRRKYQPCSICDSEKIGMGRTVYCFLNEGNSYHTENCTTVDRYVIKIEKSEAISRGYSSCLKCGGS